MQVDGTHYRTIWTEDDVVRVIDQTMLPHRFEIVSLRTLDDAARAIADMTVRGAPLIGATAAWGLALGLQVDATDAALERGCAALLATRPTAVNLRWALDRVAAAVRDATPGDRAELARREAASICDEDVAACRAIGTHGLELLRTLHARRDRTAPLQILTHCNAGWLATVDWGTALAPVYVAHDAGIPVHVWVDETRPRNQGATLTAWELGRHGVPHTVIVDNAGGHLMQHGKVDCCITGSDRTTASGDVCNKIGTYLKALAARANDVPFYVALPGSTVDWTLHDGRDIPIEERDAGEVARVRGRTDDGRVVDVQVIPDGSPCANHAFDVTPADLVTTLITERGVTEASTAGLARLFPDLARTTEQPA